MWSRCTAGALHGAARFLDSLLDRTPVSHKALLGGRRQRVRRGVRGGLPAKRITAVRAPPKSPKLNAHVDGPTHPQRGVYEVQGRIRPGARAQRNYWAGRKPQLRAPASIVSLPHAPRVRHPMEAQPTKGKVSLIYWTSTLLYLPPTCPVNCPIHPCSPGPSFARASPHLHLALPTSPGRDRLDQHGHRGHHDGRPAPQQRPIIAAVSISSSLFLSLPSSARAFLSASTPCPQSFGAGRRQDCFHCLGRARRKL